MARCGRSASITEDVLPDTKLFSSEEGAREHYIFSVVVGGLIQPSRFRE